ncbi:MAG: hypothetical protein ABIH23_06040 [bacterium]
MPYKPYEIADFSFDWGSFEGINTEISDFVLANMDASDYLSIIGTAANFGLDWVEAQGGMDAARQELEDQLAILQRELADAKNRGELAGKDFQEAYDRAVRFAEENFGLTRDRVEQMFTEALDENVAAQGENRRQATQQILTKHLQGEVSQGQQAAKTAQSGVRRSGSAMNLLTENARMFDVDVQEIDKQLAVQEAASGRERDRMRADRTSTLRSAETNRNQIVEEAQGRFTSGFRGLTGRDIDFTGFFAGDQSFLESMGSDTWFDRTILTTPVYNRITGIGATRNILEEQWAATPYGRIESGFISLGNWLVDIWDKIF